MMSGFTSLLPSRPSSRSTSPLVCGRRPRNASTHNTRNLSVAVTTRIPLQTPPHLPNQTVCPRTPSPRTITVTANPTNRAAAVQSTFTQQSPPPVRWPEKSYAVSSLISLNYSSGCQRNCAPSYKPGACLPPCSQHIVQL